LHHCRDHPSWNLVEVYDYTQPPTGIEIATVEPFSAWYRIVLAMIGIPDYPEHQLNLVHELRTAEGQVQSRPGVEDDFPTVGIEYGWSRPMHRRDARRTRATGHNGAVTVL
jgi:hypothetical protein